MEHVALDTLKTGLPHVLEAPKHEGRLDLIVRRPEEAQREILEEAMLDTGEGLVGGAVSASTR